MNYYNEFDPHAAAWLRELITAGQIPAGHVDTRSIADVTAGDVRGYTQCHFFAGIAGWPLALRLAGWPADRPVWTGSCPCQPFSTAGKQRGTADERHLWPEFYRLIRECSPPVVFGEQVASPAALGWLDGVFADLEASGYACGAADLCAAGVGAPHIRQRLCWVAHAYSIMRGTRRGCQEGHARQPQVEPSGFGDAVRLGDAVVAGLEGHAGHGDDGRESRRIDAQSLGPASATGGAWDSFDILQCLDGKARRIESGTFPPAHGVSGRVGLLRGYGNAIVPQLAAEFILAACLDA